MDKRTEFLAETLRSLIFATGGLLMGILLLDHWERSRAYGVQLDREKLRVRADAIDEFLTASYEYTSELHDRNIGEDSPTFESIYDRYRLSQNRLEVYFGDPIAINLKAVRDRTDMLYEWRKADKNHDQWESGRMQLKDENLQLAKTAEGTLAISKLSESRTVLTTAVLVAILLVGESFVLWRVLWCAQPTANNVANHSGK